MAARSRGRKGGRSRGFPKKAERTSMLAQTLYNERKLGVNAIAKELLISRMTLYKYLRHRGIKIHGKTRKSGLKIDTIKQTYLLR